MSQQPPITIVIPVRDRRSIVCRTLESVREQTLRPLRVVVVDNGSTDGTPDVVRRWAADNAAPGFEVTVAECPDGGACGARNCGLALVDTPWVAFFDSDDVMLPGHLDRVARDIRRFPDVQLFYFDIAFIDADGWMDIKSLADDNIMRAHLLHGALSTCRFVVQTELVRSVGAWDTGCRRWNDLELGVRLLLAKPRVRKVTGEPMVHQYPSADSITGSGYYDAELRCETALDIIDSRLDDSMTLERRWVDCRRAILAAWYVREGHAGEAARVMRPLLAAGSLADALRLRAIYAATRLFGRGGTFLATLLYHPPRPRRNLRK